MQPHAPPGCRPAPHKHTHVGGFTGVATGALDVAFVSRESKTNAAVRSVQDNNRVPSPPLIGTSLFPSMQRLTALHGCNISAQMRLAPPTSFPRSASLVVGLERKLEPVGLKDFQSRIGVAPNVRAPHGPRKSTYSTWLSPCTPFRLPSRANEHSPQRPSSGLWAVATAP